jgi:hypothetical protein
MTKLMLSLFKYLASALALSFVFSFSTSTLAAPTCQSLFAQAPTSLTPFFAKALQYERQDYLQALAFIAKEGVSAEVYNGGGRMNVREDQNGQILRENHGMKMQYHANLPQVLKALETYPQNFKDLLADQGILNHADEFIAFLKTCATCKSMDPWEVRRLASKAIGTKTMYRGAFLSEQIAQKIKQEGFTARIFDTSSARDKNLIQALTSPYPQQLEQHMRDTAKSALISVSAHPEVSIAVARKFAEGDTKNQAVYLFKLEIPKLDLLHHENFDRPEWITEREETRELDAFYVTGKKGEVLLFEDGPELESLVLFRILPSEIVEMKKVIRSPYKPYQPEGMID